MTIGDKQLWLCSCNGTMPLDAAALARNGIVPEGGIKTMLCQKELGAFASLAHGDAIVACTQEARLLGDIAEEAGKTQTIQFVNIRENAGWSADAKSATPKIAALLSLASMPEPDPVPRVAYTSNGQILIIGPLDRALFWA